MNPFCMMQMYNAAMFMKAAAILQAQQVAQTQAQLYP
jgi:hypothetical protein